MTKTTDKGVRPVCIRTAFLASVASSLVCSFLVFWYFYVSTNGGAGPIVGLFPDRFVTIWSFEHCRQFLAGSIPELYSTTSLFAPSGASLVLHNLTEVACLTSAWFGVDPIAQAYLPYAAVMVVNGCAATWLFCLLSGHIVSSVFLGVLYVFHPFFLGHLDGGHLNLVISFPLSLLWSGIFLAFINRPFPAAFLVSTAIVLAIFSDWYGLYLCLMSVAGVVIWQTGLLFLARIPHTQPTAGAPNTESTSEKMIFPARRNSATPPHKNHFFAHIFNILRPLATVEYGGCGLSRSKTREVTHTSLIAIAVIIVSAALALLVGAWKISAALNLSASGLYTPHHDPRLHAANLLHFVTPTKYQQIGAWFAAWPASWGLVNSAESGVYLGATLLLLSYFARPRFFRGRTSSSFGLLLLSAAIIFWVFSLGPAIKAGPYTVVSNPLFLLVTKLTGIIFPVPARAFAGVLLLLLAWLAYVKVLVPASSVKIVLVFLLAIIEFFPQSMHASVLPVSDGLKTLQAAPVGLVVDLGAPELATARVVSHGKPITGGFLARSPRAAVVWRRQLMSAIRGCDSEPDKVYELLSLAGVQTILLETSADGALADNVDKCNRVQRWYSGEDLILWRVMY